MHGRHKLTKSLIDTLRSESKPYIVYDTELSGFGIRVGTDSKVYLVQKRIGGTVVKRTIGKHGTFTPDQARQEAKAVLYKLSQGQDPLTEKRLSRLRSELTFGNLVTEFLAERRLKPNTIKDYRTKVERLLADWLPLPANEITRSMVRERFAELLEHPTQAALVARCARAIFNFGIEHYRDDKTGESEIKQNPIEAFTKGVNKKMPKPRRRDDYLNNTQLPGWFEAIESLRQQHCNVVDYLVVVLLLGGRRTEVARMKWADVDLDQSMVAMRDTKNTRDHHLPLPAHVHEIFKRRREAAPEKAVFVFPGDSKMGYLTEPRYVMEKIVESTGVKFAMHDLRRTFATAADALDLNQRTIKRLMNHVDNQNDVTLGYIIHDVDRLREPMQKIENYILIAGGVKKASPTPPSDDQSATNV